MHTENEKNKTKLYSKPRPRHLAWAMAAIVGCSGSMAQALPLTLGTAGDFALLAGSKITNEGNTTVMGNIGVSPLAAITGFFGTIEDSGPGSFIGSAHQADAVALQAKADAVTAYGVLAGLPTTQTLTGQDLGLVGTLSPGVYFFADAAQLTGTLTLDGGGLERPLFVFQIGSALTTASDSVVSLLNGADDCNIFWQIGSSATLGERTDFAGTIIADQSISLTDAAKVNGRLIALDAAITLINNEINLAECDELPVSPDLVVTGPGNTPVPDGGIADLSNGTDFGSSTVGDLIQQIFTITNTGAATLEVGPLDITGDFTLIGQFPTSIVQGESAQFIIELDTTTSGSKVGTLIFTTTAPSSPFDINLTALVNEAGPGGGNAQIPEPASCLLLLAGMFTLAGSRRKVHR